MRIQIDQSGKVEETARPTIVAFTNRDNATIFISSNDKKKLLRQFRKRGKREMYIFYTFAALILLLTQDYLDKITHIEIDTEYPGREALIKGILIELARHRGYSLNKYEIGFKSVGRKSKVHKLAIETFRKKRKPTKLATHQTVNSILKP